MEHSENHRLAAEQVSAPPSGSSLPPEDLPALAQLLSNDHVQARLQGEPHRHHRDCIHNLPPDEQIAARGRTIEWWQAMGLAMPTQISPAEWTGGAAVKLTDRDTEAVSAFSNFLSWGERPAGAAINHANRGRAVPPAWFAYVMGLTTWCPPRGEL